MCLILFNFKKHSKYKFILAANRDEFFNRDTVFADFWNDNANILGGRDVQSEGTWLGINKNGRFIAITNYRDPQMDKENAKSRGVISKSFLNEKSSTEAFINQLAKEKMHYNGFNILLSADGFKNLYHYSNVSDQLTRVDAGIHGLSNALLDSPWPKVNIGKKSLKEISTKESPSVTELMGILKDRKTAPNSDLPDTGIPFDLEQKLSPLFISLKDYGTRCSSVLLITHENEVGFHEWTYDEHQKVINEASFKTMLKY